MEVPRTGVKSPRTSGQAWLARVWDGRAVPVLRDLKTAWHDPAVKRGVLGSCLLFVGSLSPAYLPQSSPLWAPMRALGLDNWPVPVVETVAAVVAVALIVEAWLRLRHVVYVRIKHWAVGVWWSLPLLAAPPVFSHDAYGYAAEGWLLRNGLSPYENAISVLPGPFADQAAWVWRYDTAMYPPLSLRMFEGMVVVGGQDPYWSTLAMRIPALVGVALIWYYLPRIARRIGVDAAFTAWLAAINPLLLIDLVGGMHNDALMMGLVVTALWLALNGRFWVAAVVVGVAASIKQPALLAAFPVAMLGHPWRSWAWRDTSRALVRLAASFGVTIGVFVGISFVSGLGFGWVNAAAVPGKIVNPAPVTMIAAGVRWLLAGAGGVGAGDVAYETIRAAGLALSFAVIAALALTVGRRRPITLLCWGYLVFAFGGLALNSWYLTWGGALLPLARPSERTVSAAVIVTAISLVFEAGYLAWRNDAFALGFAGLVLMGAIVWYDMIRRGQATAARGREVAHA